MPLATRPSSNFPDAAFQFIALRESFEAGIYGDTVGVPTIGYGYALAIKSGTRWSLKATLVQDLAALGISLTATQLATLNTILSALNAGNAASARNLSDSLGDQVGTGDVRLITQAEGQTLFGLELQRALNAIQGRFARFLGTADGTALFGTLTGSTEMVALASMAYNGQETIGPKLASALHHGDRAEAWYQIRYATNPQGIHASRRYRESDLFSLYNIGVNEQEGKSIYRMFTRHREQILAYEQTYDPTNPASNSTRIQDQLTGATNFFLGSTYTHGIAVQWDHIYVGENDGSDGGEDTRWYRDGRANDDVDDLRGSASNDLIFAESGDDQVTGGAGQDVIYGGSGHDILSGGGGNDYLEGGIGDDTYYLESGDGQDQIKDPAGNNTVVFDGTPVTHLVRNVGETSYHTPDGRFTAAMQGDSLLVTDTVTGSIALLTDFVEGDFGIQFHELGPIPPAGTYAPITCAANHLMRARMMV